MAWIEIMFPDSEAAESYRQVQTKIKYSIQFGLASHIKECFLYEKSNFTFSFKFDETTASKVQKKYNVHAQNWSKKSYLVENHYSGSLFGGHCTNEDLLKHYEHFVSEKQSNSSYLFHLGMDGPNVNLAFQKCLGGQLLKDALSGLRQFLATEIALKILKNIFYFTSKSFFVLKIFKFLF